MRPCGSACFLSFLASQVLLGPQHSRRLAPLHRQHPPRQRLFPPRHCRSAALHRGERSRCAHTPLPAHLPAPARPSLCPSLPASLPPSPHPPTHPPARPSLHPSAYPSIRAPISHHLPPGSAPLSLTSSHGHGLACLRTRAWQATRKTRATVMRALHCVLAALGAGGLGSRRHGRADS